MKAEFGLWQLSCVRRLSEVRDGLVLGVDAFFVEEVSGSYFSIRREDSLQRFQISEGDALGLHPFKGATPLALVRGQGYFTVNGTIWEKLLYASSNFDGDYLQKKCTCLLKTDACILNKL